MATFSKGVVIPEYIYIAFQLTFAAITPCLIVGAFADRIKFSAVLLFMVLWFTFSYLPIAHMVWYWAGPDAYTTADAGAKATATAGFLFQKGALDFAGGTVVHINAGIAGLVGALVIGKRLGYGKEAMPPHSLTMTMIGASLLWMGWFGFNVGSNLEATGTAAMVFSTRRWPPQPRPWRGCSANGSSAANPPCWARPPVQLPVSSPSRRLAVSSVRWAPSSSASSPAWCACGR